MYIQYQEKDNIVLDSTVNEIYNSQNPTTNTIKTTDGFEISYNEYYPTYNDITIYDSTGLVEQIDSTNPELSYLNITPNSLCVIKIPVINDKIKEISGTYFYDDENKYKIQKCELTLISTKVNSYDINNKLLFEKIYNTTNSNFVDYILDSTNDFKTDEQIKIQGEIQGVVQRDLYISPRSEYIPNYIFECKKDSTTTFMQIFLEILPQSTGAVSNYYEFKTIDSTSFDSNDMHSVETLPMLLKMDKFKKFCQNILSKYDEINLLISINNFETDPELQQPIKLYNNNFKYSQKGCSIFTIDLLIDRISLIKSIHSNGILNLRIKNKSLTDYQNYTTQNIKILIKNNSTEYNKINLTDYTLDFNTTNYLNLNNNIISYDMDWLDSTSTPVKIILNNVTAIQTFKLSEIELSLTRKNYKYKNTHTTFHQNAMIYEKILLEKMLVNKIPYSITTNKMIDFDMIITQKFFQNKNNIQGVLEEDVLNTLNLIKNVDVTMAQRKIAENSTYIYIEFNYDKTVSYLKRFLEQENINNILNNIILSVNGIDRNNQIIQSLITLSTSNFITKYINDYKITYVYNYISSIQFTNINGVFDRKLIEKYLITNDTTSQENSFVPNDVFLINNIQKLN